MWRFRRGWTSGSILSGAVVTGRECGRRLLIHFPDSKLRRKLMTGKTRALGVGIAAIFICICVICGVVAGGAKAQSGGAPQTTNAAGPKKAEEQFKNIQVLKGIPADQLIPAMQFITASLGVECEFCHVQGAFEKDDKKPKQTARKMMEMMFAINKDNFEGHRAVTCNSCHRGNAVPQAIPAVGGAAAIGKITSRVMKGTIDFGGKSLPIDIYSKDPDQRISFTHMPEGDSVTAFNGHEG